MALPTNPPRHILVQEEYGFRHWIGTLPADMTTEAVVEWWEKLKTVEGMFFNPSKCFPVPLIELEDIEEEDNVDRALWSWVDEKTGERHVLDRHNVVLFCHTHDDSDSYLKVVGSGHHYHAGYGEFDGLELEEEEELPPPTQDQLDEWAKESPLVERVVAQLWGG